MAQGNVTGAARKRGTIFRAACYGLALMLPACTPAAGYSPGHGRQRGRRHRSDHGRVVRFPESVFFTTDPLDLSRPVSTLASIISTTCSWGPRSGWPSRHGIGLVVDHGGQGAGLAAAADVDGERAAEPLGACPAELDLSRTPGTLPVTPGIAAGDLQQWHGGCGGTRPW
jgi:hypothetical protein